VKSSTFPSLLVEPELREAAESVLREGETLTSLIKTFVRETIQRRRSQDEFIARGLRSREDAEQTGAYHSAESVHSELQPRLDVRRKSVRGRTRRLRSGTPNRRGRTCCGCSTSWLIGQGLRKTSIRRSWQSTRFGTPWSED
jgi:hypothetical protein